MKYRSRKSASTYIVVYKRNIEISNTGIYSIDIEQRKIKK